MKATLTASRTSHSLWNNTALLALLLVLLAWSGSARAAVTVTGFSPTTYWRASDVTLGVAGFVIEDFEDVTLVAGLEIGCNTLEGNRPISNTLPGLLDPQLDPFGNSFQLGIWDGTHALINTRDNQIYSYGSVTPWGDLLFRFSPTVTSVGFSIQSMNGDVRLIVDGEHVGWVLRWAGLATSGGRNGYVRIDAAFGEMINSLRLQNSFADGFILDHLAFQPTARPEATRATIEVSEVRISWNTDLGKRYQVQYRSALTLDAWANLGPPLDGTGSQMSIADALAGPQRFYQIVVTP